MMEGVWPLVLPRLCREGAQLERWNWIRSCDAVPVANPGRNERNQLAHQFVVSHHFPALGSTAAVCMKCQPGRLHHIVIPVDMAFHDFAASRVSNTGAACIGDINGFVHNS